MNELTPGIGSVFDERPPGMAAKLRTSRTQINRILDPANGELSIATLRKAAEAVGRKLKIELE